MYTTLNIKLDPCKIGVDSEVSACVFISEPPKYLNISKLPAGKKFNHIELANATPNIIVIIYNKTDIKTAPVLDLNNTDIAIDIKQ